MKQTRASGWWYPWIFVGGFLVVLAVNATMLYHAWWASRAGSLPGNPFEEGLRYNEVLAESRARQTLGWTVGLRSEILSRSPEGLPTVRLYLSARDREGAALDNAEIDALLYRPVGAGLDTPLSFVRAGNGYQADVTLPAPGQWEARIRFARGSDTYRLHQRLFAR